MVFDSYTYVLFLCLILPAYYFTPSLAWKRVLMLVGSLYFYGAWNPPFTLLLLFCSLVAWGSAELIDRSESRQQRRMWLVLGIGLNLGLLVFYKYGMFLWGNARALGEVTHWYQLGSTPRITLPVGISFFTFQAMSYTFDVFLKRHGRARSFRDFLLYISFFPQLVAGPIVRFHEFSEQMYTPKPFRLPLAVAGLQLIILGLFQKVVIADGICAEIVDIVYDQMTTPSTLAAWGGTIAFAVQIYCDFAGYSTTAIGTALLFGYQLPLNFNAPYGAVGFSDFWRRWHISLSTWLRDYLFIPLGGSRGSGWETIRNLMITMVLGGLWHGAAWTFVIWGAMHGILLSLERSLGRRSQNGASGIAGHLLAAITFLAICLTWVPFRARSFDSMRQLLAAMAGFGHGTPLAMKHVAMALALGAILFAVHRLRASGVLSSRWSPPPWASGLVYGGMLYLIFTAASSNRNFIYFQF